LSTLIRQINARNSAGICASHAAGFPAPVYTLTQAASSPGTQAFLLVGTLFLLPVIFFYTGWSYWVFRGRCAPTWAIIELQARRWPASE
jgi:Cytochrome bd terminal oxidase subunit II